MRHRILPLLLIGLHVQAQQWTPLADLPAITRDDAVSFTIGSQVFVGTGMDAGFQLRADWYRYTTWNNAWSAAAPLPSAGRQHAVSFSLNDQGYLQGGLTSAGPTTELWMYDPALDIWTVRSPLPSTPRYASACFTVGGLAYVAGGAFQNGTTTAQLFAYDPVTNVWVARAPMPGPPRQRAMAFSALGKGYVFGGVDGQFIALRDGWSYDPMTNSWSPVDSLPEARYTGNCIDLQDGGLLIGGASDESTVHADVWRYSAWNDSWTVLPAFPAGPRRGAAGTAWGGTKAYFGTGSDVAQRYADWWMLDLPVGIGEISPPAWRAYPNPCTDLVWLEGPSRPMEAVVTDGMGRTVLRATVAPDRSLDLSALGPGRYCVRSPGGVVVPVVKLP